MSEAICFVPAFWENIKTDLSPYTELESIIFKFFSQNWHKFVSNFVNLRERLSECKQNCQLQYYTYIRLIQHNWFKSHVIILSTLSTDGGLQNVFTKQKIMFHQWQTFTVIVNKDILSNEMKEYLLYHTHKMLSFLLESSFCQLVKHLSCHYETQWKFLYEEKRGSFIAQHIKTRWYIIQKFQHLH